MKKTNKLISILLVAAMLLSMAPMSLTAFAATPTPYDGVPVTPQVISSGNYAKLGLTDTNWSQFNGYYAIRNAKELYGFADIVFGTYSSATSNLNAVLLQDVVVNANGGSTYNWTPLYGRGNDRSFNGIIDGNGHYISGLYCTQVVVASLRNDRVSGFIACLYQGTVKNLVIKDSTFAPSQSLNQFGGMGAITGYPVKCTIENCRVENTKLTALDNYGQVGGITGYGDGQNSTIKNCVSLVTISGGGSSNAISVYASSTNCYTSASATHTCANISVEHKEVKATCEYPGLSNYKYCLVCGNKTSGTKTETPATGHTWQSATCQAPKTCSACDLTEGSVEPHKYTTYTLSANAMCGANAKEMASCDYGCGTTDTREISGTALVHSYTYSASGNTVTAVCANGENCPNPQRTLTISAPAELYVDGTAKEAIVENNLGELYVVVGDSIKYSTADGYAPTTAGTYTASITVEGATASIQFELVKRSAIAENFVYTAPENLVYDGTPKYATVNVSPEITGMGEITIAYYQNGEAVEPINAGTYTVKVSVAESDKYYAISDIDVGEFEITKKPVTASATVADKVYDGTADIDSSAIEITFDGIVDGDDFEVSKCTGMFLSPNAGNNKTLNIAYYVSGEDVNNYDIYEDGIGVPEKEYYFIETKATILPKDIADAEIALGDTLTYNGAEQTQEVTSVTVDGFNVTYNISGNTATNVGVYELTITGNGNFAGTKTALYTINPDLSGIEGIDQYNVKSTNKADVEYVYNQLDNAVTDLASDEKKAEWKEIKDECWQWLKILESVEGKVESLGNSHLAYDIDTVTSADDEALEYLEAEMYLFMRDYHDNMTEEELLKVDNARIEISKLRDRIAETKSEYDRVIAAANGYDEATVTSADKDALIQLDTDIFKLALTNNVTAEEKNTLMISHSNAFYCIQKITYVSDEIKRIVAELEKYVFESVKSSDKADIQQLIADIKALTDTQNITADERALLETADETCGKLIAKIDETVAEINRINDATNAYDIDTVTSADKADIEKLIADIKALTDGDNITDAEREQLNGNKETLEALLERINETAEEFERINGEADSYEVDSVKSPDKEAVVQLKEDIESLKATDNVTEEEKALLEEKLEKVTGLINRIIQIEDQLEKTAEMVNGYDSETVTSDDKAAIEDAIAEIEAVNPDNLTDAQKAEYAEIKADLESLLDEIEAAENAVEEIGVELEMFDENRVTIFWEDDIEALKAKIDELLTDENMGEAEIAKLNEYKAQANKLIEIIHDPCEYFSCRFFYFIWDALHWLSSHVVFIFNWIF